MASHSSILAYRIPWREEPGGLLSMGSQRVGHDWSDLAAAAALRIKTKISGHCKRFYSFFVCVPYLCTSKPHWYYNWVYLWGMKRRKRRKKESEVAQSCPILQHHELQPTRLLSLWNSPGKNTGVGCHLLLQGTFSTQGSNPGLPHCRQTLLPSEGDEDHLKSAWVGKVSLLQWSKSRLAPRLHRYPTLILNELCNLYLSFPWCTVKLNNSYSINILKWFNWCRLVSFLFDSVYDIQRCPI